MFPQSRVSALCLKRPPLKTRLPPAIPIPAARSFSSTTKFSMGQTVKLRFVLRLFQFLEPIK